MAPNSDDLEDWARDRGLDPQNVRNEIENTTSGYCGIRRSLESAIGVTGSVELRYHFTAPDFRLYALDSGLDSGRLLFVPYLSGVFSAHSPAYLLAPNSVFAKQYLGSVQSSWNKAHQTDGICGS